GLRSEFANRSPLGKLAPATSISLIRQDMQPSDFATSPLTRGFWQSRANSSSSNLHNDLTGLSWLTATMILFQRIEFESSVGWGVQSPPVCGGDANETDKHDRGGASVRRRVPQWLQWQPGCYRTGCYPLDRGRIFLCRADDEEVGH